MVEEDVVDPVVDENVVDAVVDDDVDDVVVDNLVVIASASSPPPQAATNNAKPTTSATVARFDRISRHRPPPLSRAGQPSTTSPFIPLPVLVASGAWPTARRARFVREDRPRGGPDTINRADRG
jgi:hypothetical protein